MNLQYFFFSAQEHKRLLMGMLANISYQIVRSAFNTTWFHCNSVSNNNSKITNNICIEVDLVTFYQHTGNVKCIRNLYVNYHFLNYCHWILGNNLKVFYTLLNNGH